MPYLAKHPAAKDMSELLGIISTAQLQWNTYATLLGSAYTKAYKKHEDAIKDTQDKAKMRTEMAYWVLSLLCVSLAGDLTGGLMGPWAAGASTAAAQRMVTMISGAVSGGSGMVTQKVIDENKGNGALHLAPVKSPLEFWQDMLGEIGVYASRIRDTVEEHMRIADNDPFKSHFGRPNFVRNAVDTSPFLRDYPTDNDMPDDKETQRVAELGLWIAWANTLNASYWKGRTDPLRDGLDYGNRREAPYLLELRGMGPVVARLQELGAAHLGTMIVVKETPLRNFKETVLDVPKLRISWCCRSVDGARREAFPEQCWRSRQRPEENLHQCERGTTSF